jgi:hypothetical protein
MNLYRYTGLLFLSLISFVAVSQSRHAIDSLKSRIQRETTDTVKIKLLNKLAGQTVKKLNILMFDYFLNGSDLTNGYYIYNIMNSGQRIVSGHFMV